jgi:hypothetical protein
MVKVWIPVAASAATRIKKSPPTLAYAADQRKNLTRDKLSQLPELNLPRHVRQLSSICIALKQTRLLYNAAGERIMLSTIAARRLAQ